MADETKLPEAGLIRAAWRQEVLRAGAMLLFALALGFLFGYVLTWLLIGAVLYVAYHARHLRRLSQWVEHPKRVELPEPGGIWGEIYERLLEIQKSNKKRKRKLAEMLAQFQASTAALPDGAAVLGPHGEIVWFNNAAQALLGLRMSDVGQRVPNLVRYPAFTEYFSAADYTADVEVPSPVNSKVTLSVRIIPYGQDQRLLIARDVSQLKRMEVARRDFVANASHELRTPLTVLRGYLDMMEPESRGAGALAAWAAPIGEMRSQASRMEALLTDLLKLARLEAESGQGHQHMIDVPELLRELLDEAQRLSGDQHRFEADIDPELRLYGRELEIHSILANLLFNAVQYTPAGGTIRVRWWASARGAGYSVTDSGIGIAEDEIPRITERFYRVDVARSRARGGTGLGLAIVKHALERLEGELQIESRLGEGSRFTCHFPSHRAHRIQRLAASA